VTLVLTLSVLGAAPISAPPARADADPGQACPDRDLQPAPDTIARVDAAIVCVVNGERQGQGVASFSRNSHLDRSAASQSSDMVAHHYFAHETSGRPTLLERVIGSGYFNGAATGLYAEDLAVGPTVEATARNVVAAWMQSPDHRANLLDTRLREMGIGAAFANPDPVFYADYPSTVYTADFGRRDGVAVAKSTPRGCPASVAGGGTSSSTPPRRYCAKHHRRVRFGHRRVTTR
jgi:uncharacterized protein YkwD